MKGIYLFISSVFLQPFLPSAAAQEAADHCAAEDSEGHQDDQQGTNHVNAVILEPVQVM